jgi:FlaA1/EpsC-like NDP-sugar epimerase
MLKEQERHFSSLIYFLDCISILLSFALAVLVGTKVTVLTHLHLNKLLAVLPILSVAAAFFYQFLYRRRAPWSRTINTVIRDAVIPGLLAGAVFVAIAMLCRLPLRDFFFTFLFVFLSWLFSSVHRMIFVMYVRFEQKRGKLVKYVLLVGTGERAQGAARLLDGHPGWGLQLVGFLTTEKSEVGMIISNYKVIGLVEDLPNILENTVVDTVFFAGGDRDHAAQIDRLAGLCEMSGKEFVPHAPGL